MVPESPFWRHWEFRGLRNEQDVFILEYNYPFLFLPLLVPPTPLPIDILAGPVLFQHCFIYIQSFLSHAAILVQNYITSYLDSL